MSVTLLGGEMVCWSDRDASRGPAPAGGAALRSLLVAACARPSGAGRTAVLPSERILVAGAHEPALIDAITAEHITLLVRSLDDAEALAARYADRPGVTVCCGALANVAALPTYDTVVALDGLHRLGSAESDDLTWGESLSLLLAVLRPGGRLLLGVENFFGLHRILALPPEPGDVDWSGIGEHDPSRPAGPTRLRDRLERAGLRVVRQYAGYPLPNAPTALFGDGLRADPELGGFLEAVLRRAGEPGEPMLADPARLTAGVVRHGLTAELSPGWFVVAEKGAHEADTDALPDAVLATDGAAQEVRLAGPTDHPGDASSRPGVPGVGDLGDRAAGVVIWRSGNPPRGRSLEDLLLAAAERRDVAGLRELLVGWQASPAAGVPADQIVVAIGGGFAAVAPVGEPLAAVRRFATTMICRGLAHLWPSPADEAELTALLATMAGREPTATPACDGGGRPNARAFRELAMAHARLVRELAEARAKHEWYEQMLTDREAELKRVRRINAALAATVPGRLASRMVVGLRAGKRTLRSQFGTPVRYARARVRDWGKR